MTPTVTCIIPVRNGAATIERAVKSAVDAGCDKVLVFDDNSSEDINLVLYKMELNRTPKHAHKIKYINLRLGITSGVNAARNYLCSLVPNDQLIICLDADDTLHDIAPLVAAWEPNTWVYGDHNEVNGETVTRQKGAPAGGLPRKNITGVTFLFAKDDWQRVGGFNPNYAYCEDYAFQCALTNAGVQPKYIETVVYDRYLHPEGNERTVLAGEYWNFYRNMCRRDYPNVFIGTT